MKIITWDEYFMALSKLSAMRSKDPNTKVGAVLVNKNNRVIALGYNGMPNGNDNLPWDREGNKKIDTKYPYVVHAEMNAVLNSTQSTENSVLYVSLFPCSNCAKLLVQAGIKEIVYEDDKYEGTEDDIISHKIFDESKVTYRKIQKINVSVD